MNPSRNILLAIVLLSGFVSGCGRKHVAVPMTPPPPSKPAAATGSAESMTPPPPPQIETTTLPPESAPLPAPAQLPPPPAQRRPRPTPAQVTPAPAPSPQAPAPQLGPVLSADALRENNEATDRAIQSALNNLRSVASRPLSKQQQDDRDQVRNFIDQAQNLRRSDLPAARRLAEKAAMLADTLAKGF